MLLSELKVKQAAVIKKVNSQSSAETQSDLIASRLETLGFIPGATVKVIARGIFGGDPMLIQIGFTRFALRKAESEKIEIMLEQGSIA
ncbi:FeoA family protein [Acinetobacter apis]|uniref:Ferrous iron transport protein A n=1 Tax=Acinetobacter apis TaxID=1229165 RepID=A0A217EI60_9GAMM|nr:FeoA family protein [Acinetobacter apis]SNQ30044.1 ferrous iron transport protein A [Acinetobacter apis]